MRFSLVKHTLDFQKNEGNIIYDKSKTSLEMDGTLDFNCFHLGAKFYPE